MILWFNIWSNFMPNGKGNVKMGESFLYFAYGCALNQTLVEFRINQAVKLVGKGELKNYVLKFNRKNPDGSARANLFYSENDFVLGVIYKVGKNKFEQLAQTEPEYQLTSFSILTQEGPIEAFAFICEHYQDGIVPDKKDVLRIAEYARSYDFPQSYIDKILSALPQPAVVT